MSVGTSKKSANQPDHTTRKFKTKTKRGLPVYSWVTTKVENGKFTQIWESV